MYTLDAFHDHYDKLEKDFHKLFLDFQIRPEGKTIHQLRINIKKQIAFFRLLRALEPHLPLEEIQTPFAAFFKSIGKIRNLEIRQNTLAAEEEKFKVSHAYSNRLETNILEERAWWQEGDNVLTLVPFRKVSDKVRTSIDRIPLTNIQEELGEYFYFLFNEISQTIRQEAPKAEQLHDLRKLLKVLFYNLKVADRVIDEEVIPEKYYKTIHSLNEQLGDWHDKFITVYKLNAKRAKVDKRVLQLLRKKERIARKEIIKSFPTIYDLTKDLKKEVTNLFTQENIKKITHRRFTEGKYRVIKDSLAQVNLREMLQ